MFRRELFIFPGGCFIIVHKVDPTRFMGGKKIVIADAAATNLPNIK